jgi:hypothetical protein
LARVFPLCSTCNCFLLTCCVCTTCFSWCFIALTYVLPYYFQVWVCFLLSLQFTHKWFLIFHKCNCSILIL